MGTGQSPQGVPVPAPLVPSPALRPVSSASSLLQLLSAWTVVLNSESQSLEQTTCMSRLKRTAWSGRGCTWLRAGWVPTSLSSPALGIPASTWPDPLFGGCGCGAYVRKAVLHVVGAGGSSHAFPHVHKPLCTSTVAQAGGHGTNMASPCAATLLGLKVPGPCFPWTGSCFPLVQADLYAEVSKRFSAPCLTPGLLFCLLCAHL